jgi:hypothetical protein
VPVPRGRRTGLAAFGRRGRDGAGALLADLGCPDCSGVLAIEELPGGQLSFTCRIGHTFAGASLQIAKEEELETALWTAVETFEEVVMLHLELAARFRRNGGRAFAVRYERRAALARKQSKALRRLIARERPALGPDEPRR